MQCIRPCMSMERTHLEAACAAARRSPMLRCICAERAARCTASAMRPAWQAAAIKGVLSAFMQQHRINMPVIVTHLLTPCSLSVTCITREAAQLLLVVWL